MTVIFNQAPLEKLVVEHAKEWVEEIVKEMRENGKKFNDETCKTQLRKFYQEFNNIRNYIVSRSNPDKPNQAFEERLVTLKMLIAKAEYAKGRKIKTLPLAFINPFIKNISAIEKRDDVEKFGYYFEALIGFFYSASTDNNQQGQRNNPNLNQRQRSNNFNNQNRSNI